MQKAFKLKINLNHFEQHGIGLKVNTESTSAFDKLILKLRGRQEDICRLVSYGGDKCLYNCSRHSTSVTVSSAHCALRKAVQEVT